METFAVLHAFVAYEDLEECPELRSRIGHSLSLLKSTLALGIGGCIAAMSMLAGVNAVHAAARQNVKPKSHCSTVQAMQQQSFIHEDDAPALANSMFSGKTNGKTEKGMMHLLRQYGVMPFYVLDIAPAIALGIGLDAVCDGSSSGETRDTAIAPIPTADAPASRAQPEARSNLPNFGARAAVREPRFKWIIASAVADQQQEPIQATRIVLKRGERRVYVYQGEQELASFPVAVGKPGWETPAGTFAVKTMAENPGWTHPFTGKVMSPESDNPLGERWIEFWTDGYNSIGFHGTPNRASVGQAASHGCVRMYDEDIQKLFNWVSEGTPVIVEP